MEWLEQCFGQKVQLNLFPIISFYPYVYMHGAIKRTTALFFVFMIHRREKLEESLQYQQFLVGVDEAEGWLNEKITLVSSDEVGDTLAAVQVSF